MICKLEKKGIEEIEPVSNFLQTSFWGRIKYQQGFFTRGFEMSVSKDLLSDDANPLERTRNDLLVLLKYIDNQHCYAYVPYGPELEPDFEHQGLFLEQLSESLRSQLPPGCLFIRYDLKWQNQWTHDREYFDKSGNWKGPPRSQIQETRVNYNTSRWNLKRSPGDQLPTDTFFLDLRLQKEDLLGKMRYNTRYNIKRAIRNGIRVEEYGLELIGDWYRLYRETAIRHDIPLPNEEYFGTILKNQDHDKSGVNVKLLMARHRGKSLSSMFLILSKKRGTYLFGASSSASKNLGASYALQWESIKLVKNWGCTEYDMFGSAPHLNGKHPLHGVHFYKKGFGRKLFHRMGCWDYPYHLKKYEYFKLSPQSSVAGRFVS